MLLEKIDKYLTDKILNEASGINLKSPASNFIVVTIGNDEFYFSYETIVAVEIDGTLLCTDEKISATTAKHLNMIDPDKKNRVPAETFKKIINNIDVKSRAGIPNISD